ncbi:probable WRKY transcription factor 26 isoform X2 [Ipomoea triloba]|uniref:probable WRKY transcription factor 26 isoform X2 n=1 Tax=Ipomoea triloba TaxID=35885 RepID=UPI00125E7830|nr:probable WRKY transcription factor 26 isoform X2 [Ipomoea triloba]
MAASSGTIDAPTASSSFSFSTASSFMSSSFTDLLASDAYSGGSVSRGLGDRIAERTGSGVPKFKSLPPPSLPLSSPAVSPSSYFAFPPGLSPSELLDSPVLLSSSNILPSPTTGTFPAQTFNWKNDSNTSQEDVKQEEKGYPDFSFQTNSASMTLNYEDSKRKDELNSLQSLPPVTTSTQMSSQNNGGSYSEYNNQCCPPSQTLREQRRSDDGYNWRKYGQKQVKGSENPRSYYKCTHPNCPTKKKVERALDGQITEIVYKGAHNHPKPQSTRRSSSSTASSASTLAAQSYNAPASDVPDQSYWSNGNGQMDSVATPENSSISVGDDEFEQSSQKREPGGDEFDEDEPDAKRWKVENESDGVSAQGSRTVREPRVVVQTTSDIDILDDGYRWRKYGQKVVKGNPNPRSYYKCTSQGCPVRKHVERASHDIRSVITTYEGKHNHDVPAARGSGSHGLNRGANPNNNAAMAMAIRPSTMSLQSNYPIPIPSTRPMQPGEGQAPYEMLQGPGGFGYSGFGNPMNAYANQIQDNAFSRAKEEPRDDLFLETLLA